MTCFLLGGERKTQEKRHELLQTLESLSLSLSRRIDRISGRATVYTSSAVQRVCAIENQQETTGIPSDIRERHLAEDASDFISRRDDPPLSRHRSSRRKSADVRLPDSIRQ